MSDKFDISGLTQITVNLENVPFGNPGLYYSPYYFFIENSDNVDNIEINPDGKYQLSLLYENGIDILPNTITIGEKVVSKSQIICTTNYNTIMSQFGNIDDVIEYEHLADLVQDISDTESSSEISLKIFNWIGKYIDLSINRNPENADDTNLILTQEISGDLQRLTETILNKIFRNLIQFIRMKHDYRLYAPGATIFGGKATELSSEEKLSQWSSIPASCWVQYTNQYVVGKSAYTEPISSVSSTIQNSKYHIGPYTSYGIASHIHTVEFNLTQELPSTVNPVRGRNILTGVTTQLVEASCHKHKDSRFILWYQAAKAGLGNREPAGYPNVGTETAEVKGFANWSYNWKSGKNCKLLPNKDMKTDIFAKSETYLPTYSSYVWRWETNDTETNITSPRQFISLYNLPIGD